MMRKLILYFSIFVMFAITGFGQKTVGKPRKFPIGKAGQNASNEKKATETISDVSPELNDSPLTILAKPRPISKFDHGCRQETIRLRIAFLETGEIGKISPISASSERLMQEAIEAAAKIRFSPAVKDGKRMTISKVLEYRFQWFWM
jgi:hypothetical protein